MFSVYGLFFLTFTRTLKIVSQCSKGFRSAESTEFGYYCIMTIKPMSGEHKVSMFNFILVARQLPATWESSIEKKIRYTVSNITDEYTSISEPFLQGMRGLCVQIIQIERIQNERWFLQYLVHCREFKERLGTNTEINLYHGCSQKSAQSIINSCFNRSFAGVNGTV